MHSLKYFGWVRFAVEICINVLKIIMRWVIMEVIFELY